MSLKTKENSNEDIALILAWPDTTIRGDEKWMMFFKKIGFVKNLNFKVGHTGIILIDRKSKNLLYYDFGRYISPRGQGRARSKDSDPRLNMASKAIINEQGEIVNLAEIGQELRTMEEATQGFGRLFFSEAYDISFEKAKKYADELVLEGSTPYGAVAWGNNNCSRFITRLLMKSSTRYHYFHGINLPETLKASPMSNVVNVKKDRKIYYFDENGQLHTRTMNRWQSLWFLIRQLRDNFHHIKSKQFPDDRIIGSMAKIKVPLHLPKHAQWLGGVGEGAWFHINTTEIRSVLEISRYTEKGDFEYCKRFQTLERFPDHQPHEIQITYDNHLLASHILIKGKQFKLFPMDEIAVSNNQQHLKLQEAENNPTKILQVG